LLGQAGVRQSVVEVDKIGVRDIDPKRLEGVGGGVAALIGHGDSFLRSTAVSDQERNDPFRIELTRTERFVPEV
jgi:hypothetical protein